MRLSFKKRLNLSARVMAAVEETLELHQRFEEVHAQMMETRHELSDCTQRLLDLHKELMDDANVPDEAEAHDDGSLRVVTTRGTYIVGAECPKHKRVHHLNGWYVCVDDGYVNVNGWYPEKVR